MKYAGMPIAMWALFHRSFTRQLTAAFGLSTQQAKAVEALAKPKYQPVSYTHLTLPTTPYV